jgi:DNA-binding MarR family transcriptional regulator
MRERKRKQQNRRERHAKRDGLAIGHLENHLGYFLRRLQIWIFRDFIERLARIDVRPAQYSVLLVIEANPGRSQAAIGETLNIERSRLARLLHALERRGWVERRSSTRDGRSHSLHLTREGEAALKRIKAVTSRHEDDVAAFVGEKRHAELMKLLRDFG